MLVLQEIDTIHVSIKAKGCLNILSYRKYQIVFSESQILITSSFFVAWKLKQRNLEKKVLPTKTIQISYFNHKESKTKYLSNSS